jgi:hypothetical protein
MLIPAQAREAARNLRISRRASLMGSTMEPELACRRSPRLPPSQRPAAAGPACLFAGGAQYRKALVPH